MVVFSGQDGCRRVANVPSVSARHVCFWFSSPRIDSPLIIYYVDVKLVLNPRKCHLSSILHPSRPNCGYLDPNSVKLLSSVLFRPTRYMRLWKSPQYFLKTRKNSRGKHFLQLQWKKKYILTYIHTYIHRKSVFRFFRSRVLDTLK